MHNIPQVRDRQKILNILDKVKIEEFKPKTGVKIKITEDNETDEMNDEDESLVNEIIQDLTANLATVRNGINLVPIDFEYDDDSNFHMDFITACSNLRAENYDISPTDKHQVNLNFRRVFV